MKRREKVLIVLPIILLFTFATLTLTQYSLSLTTPGDNFFFSVRTNRSLYHYNDSIRIRIQLANTAPVPLILSFDSACQFDYTIRSERGDLYRWSDNKVFAQTPSTLVIPPNATVNHVFTHTPSDYILYPVQSYRFLVITGYLCGYCLESRDIWIAPVPPEVTT